MKLRKFFPALLLTLLLVGCGPEDSLNPLYTSDDVIFDDTLLGKWEDGATSYNFARIADNGYRLVMSEEDAETGQPVTVVFVAHLVNLKGHRFLDLEIKEWERDDWPEIPEVHVTKTSKGMKIEPHLVAAGCGYLELVPGQSGRHEDRFTVRNRPVHWLFKVAMDDPRKELTLIDLSDSWISSQIKEGKLRVSYEMVDGNPVLTANTPELQQLVLDHVDDPEAFSDGTVMKRHGSD